MDSKNRAKIFLTISVIVVVSLVLIPPVYSGTGPPGPQPGPTSINPCPTSYECLTPSGAKEKFGLGGYGIYEKYSDDLCGDLAISTGRYCYKWLKPCPTGYECMTGDDAKDKFGEGKYMCYSVTYVCGYEGHYENPTKRFCYKSSKIEPTGEKEEVDVCSLLCPDPDEVGLGECIGYECSGPTSPQHYKAEKVEITKCIYENGGVNLLVELQDKCTGDEVTEYYCSTSSGGIGGKLELIAVGTSSLGGVGRELELIAVETSSLGGIGRELVEKEAKKVYDQTSTCPYGCENGACICRDTDGPKNYYKKGSVVGTSITDYCDFDTVVEKDPEIVNDECEIKKYEHLCGEGKICGDGACILGTLCDNKFQDIGEEGIDCGGDCPTPCCENGFWDSALGEDAVDCGGSCIPCCENGIKNWFERDVDCGITCPPCCTPDSDCHLACPPCDDANNKEFGIEYAINYYPPCDNVEDREGGDEAAEGFKEVMEDDVGWTCVFNMGGNAKERHFRDTTKGGEDWRYVDDVDLVFFASHGGMWCNHSMSPPYCAFSGCFGAEEDHCRINSKNVKLGDRDLEWLVLATCHSLENNGDNYEWYYAWRESFAGLHMICGFNDVSYRGWTTYEVGEDFADNLDDEDTVASAWLDAATDWKCCNKPAVMGVDKYTLDNDHIPGRGYVTPDSYIYDGMVWRGYNECWDHDWC